MMENNTRLSDYVRLEAASDSFMPDRINYVACPECAAPRKFMIVQDDSEALWFAKCLRASCGVSLRVPMHGLRAPSSEKLSPLPKLRHTYARASLILTPLLPRGEVGRMLASTYHLSEDQIGAYALWSKLYGRTAWRILGPEADERGIQLRRYDGLAPKAMTRPYNAYEPLTSWYRLFP